MDHIYSKVISNIFPLANSYFRETCESQYINPVYLTPKFTLGIIQIITKTCQLFISAYMLSLINQIYLSAQYQYLTLKSTPEFRQSCCLHVCLCFFPFNMLCNMTTFRKTHLTFCPHLRGRRHCVRTEYFLAWCSTTIPFN